MRHELEAVAKHAVQEIPRLKRRAPAQSLDCYLEAFDDAKIGMAAACATGDFTMLLIPA